MADSKTTCPLYLHVKVQPDLDKRILAVIEIARYHLSLQAKNNGPPQARSQQDLRGEYRSIKVVSVEHMGRSAQDRVLRTSKHDRYLLCHVRIESNPSRVGVRVSPRTHQCRFFTSNWMA